MVYYEQFPRHCLDDPLGRSPISYYGLCQKPILVFGKALIFDNKFVQLLLVIIDKPSYLIVFVSVHALFELLIQVLTRLFATLFSPNNFQAGWFPPLALCILAVNDLFVLFNSISTFVDMCVYRFARKLYTLVISYVYIYFVDEWTPHVTNFHSQANGLGRPNLNLAHFVEHINHQQ